jgi:hypothetical protein
MIATRPQMIGASTPGADDLLNDRRALIASAPPATRAGADQPADQRMA